MKSFLVALLLSGGCLGAQAQTVATATGHVEFGGVRGDWQRCSDPSTGAWSERYAFPLYTEAEGFDGKHRWKEDRSGGVHERNSPEALTELQSENWLAKHVWFGGVLAEDFSGVVLRKDPAGHVVQIKQHRLFEDASEDYDDFRTTAFGQLPFSIIETEGPSVYRITVDRYARQKHITCSRPAPPDDADVQEGGTVVPMHFDRSLTVEASINGSAPLVFILDTGGHNILTPAAAKALGLHAQGEDSATGPGGHYLKQQDVRVDSLRVGDAVLRRQHFFVLDLPYGAVERGAEAPAAGILGLELLERFAAVFDFSQNSLHLYRQGSELPGTAQPLYFSDDIPLTQGAFNGRKGIFSLDTGNLGAVILQTPWLKEQGLDSAFERGIPLSTIGGGGAGQAYVLLHQDVELAGRQLRDVMAMKMGGEGSIFHSRQEAGNFGNGVLSAFRIGLDVTANRLTLTEDPKWTPPPPNRYGLAALKVAPGALVVASVFRGSAADKAGIHAGDLILKLDGDSAEALSTVSVAHRMSDPVARQLVVTYRRGTQDATVTLLPEK